MHAARWDDSDLDDYESRQASFEGTGDWADSESGWPRSAG